MQRTIPGTIADVRPRLQDALKSQGFGILTEIDVQETLRQKIGVTVEPYVILGACNPTLAHAALQVDREIGLLLPCNVVLRQVDGHVEVSILDPEAMFSVVSPETRTALAPLGADARSRLQTALSSV